MNQATTSQVSGETQKAIAKQGGHSCPSYLKFVVLSLSLLFLATAFVSTAQATTSNRDNQLRDNLQELRKDYRALRENIKNIKEIRNDFENLKENVNTQFAALENDLSGEVLQEVKTAEEGLTSKIENSRKRLDKLVSSWEKKIGSVENEISELRINFGTKWKTLDEKTEEERNEDPWEISAITSMIILGLIVVGFLVYAWDRGYFKQMISEENRGPELQIWAALNRLDHYYEQMEKHGAERFRPLIKGQRETIRAFKERWPEKYEKVVKNKDIAGLKESEETHEEKTEESEKNVRGGRSEENW